MQRTNLSRTLGPSLALQCLRYGCQGCCDFGGWAYTLSSSRPFLLIIPMNGEWIAMWKSSLRLTNFHLD